MIQSALGSDASFAVTAHDADMFTYDVSNTPWIAQTSQRIPEILKSHLRTAGMPEHMVADKDVPYLLAAIWDGHLLDHYSKNLTSLAFASQSNDGVRAAISHTDATITEAETHNAALLHALDEEDEQRRKHYEQQRSKDSHMWQALAAIEAKAESLIESATDFLGKLFHINKRVSEAFDTIAEGFQTVTHGIQNLENDVVQFTKSQHEALLTVRHQLSEHIHSLSAAVLPDGPPRVPEVPEVARTKEVPALMRQRPSDNS
jgi:hypothetical protein